MIKYQVETVRFNGRAIIDSYEESLSHTLAEAKALAEIELEQAWREQSEIRKGHTHSEIWINMMDIDRYGDVFNSEVVGVVATIYKKYVITHRYEDIACGHESIRVFDISTFDGHKELESEFSSYEGFEEFELMLQEEFLSTDGHLYRLDCDSVKELVDCNGFKWFDSAEDVLEYIGMKIEY